MTDPRLDYVIEIMDSAGFPLGELRQWDGLSFTSIVCEVGGGQVDCRASKWNRKLVGDGAGRQVAVWRSGQVRSSGAVRISGEAVDVNADTMQLTWDDKLAPLADEPAYPNPSSATGQGPQTHDSRAGWTSSVVQGFVDANVGPSARPERRAVAFAMGADPGVGTYLNAPVVARWDNLLELVRSVALPNGIVFEVQTSDRGHTFQTRQARDLTGRVQFSRGMNNLGAGEFRRKAPEATRVLVLGPYEGTDRMVFMVPDASETVEAERRWRRKLYVLDSPTLVKADEAVYAAETAALEAAEAAEGAADDYAKYTADLATKAERKSADWNEDADRPQSEKDQAAREATAARADAGEAAANHAAKVADRVAVDAALAEATTRADRETTIHSLYDEAYRVLEEKGETVEAQFEVLDGTFDFGVDFLLGDFVSIQPDGLSSPVEKPVREVTETASSSGRKVSVVVGDYNATSGTGEALKSREVLASIRRLQTR